MIYGKVSDDGGARMKNVRAFASAVRLHVEKSILPCYPIQRINLALDRWQCRVARSESSYVDTFRRVLPRFGRGYVLSSVQTIIRNCIEQEKCAVGIVNH